VHRWLALVAVVAFAREVDAAPSAAERLFEEGRALLEAGQPEAACEKFELSIAKDPRQIGVLMNLAVCNERIGKLATALELYREALARATEANLPGAKKLAQREIDKLVPRVPVIELARASTPLPGEKLVIDNKVVSLDVEELPVDPGSHALTLTAPGRLPFETRVDVRGTDRKRVLLPVLAKPENTILERRSSPQRLVGKLMTLGGAVVVLTGGAIAYYAKSDYDSLFEGTTPHCGRYPDVDGKAVCDATGQDRAERARGLSTVATITGIAGLGIALTGVVLWATSPRETARTTILPTANETGAGVIVRGSF
jgi:tetratricopeptide (TPR) repeat protein